MTIAVINNMVLSALLIRYSKFNVERIMKARTHNIIFIAGSSVLFDLFEY